MARMIAGGVAIGVGGAGAAGAVLVRRWRRAQAASPRSSGDDAGSRWRAVTVDRGLDEVMPDGRIPAPLADLGDLVEVEVRPAPGDKGTELRARLRTPEPTGAGSVVARASGEDPRQRVRAALREAKQLIEVGEVLRVDPAPHGRRGHTPGGKLVELASRRAGGEGLL